MQTVLNNIKDERLRISIIWLPVIRSDDRASAVERSREFTDSRLSYYWDGEQYTGLAWGKTLGTGQLAWQLAWDVYLLYEAGTKWQNAAPPIPGFWMHQLRGIENAPRLKEAEFESKVREFLNRLKK